MFSSYFDLMKKSLTLLLASTTIAFSQGDIYPTETNYGGGIGFGTMFMVLDKIPGQSILDELGFNEKELGVQPLVFLGGEGFSQMSGPWRLGGYAGFATTHMTNIYEIIKYKELNSTVGFQQTEDQEQDYFNNFKVKARINFLLGALMLEYVIPIYRDLEVSAGALAGLGRYSLSIDQQIKTNMWKDIGKNPNSEFLDDKAYYAYLKDETVYVAEHDADKETYESFRDRFDSDDFLDPDSNLRYREMNLNGSMSEIGGSFFNFQPYIALKWQFLDRTGLRISAGFNQGSIGSGSMNLNSHMPIGDSPKSNLKGFTIRTMIYFGL